MSPFTGSVARRSAFVGSVCLIGLACGGIDTGDLTALVAAVQSAPPEDAVKTLVAAGAPDLVWAPCATCLQAAGMTDSTMRGPIGAQALMDFTCACPSTCVSGAMDTLGQLPFEERMTAVAAACDEEGPDPIFSGPLAPLRAASSVVDMGLVRAVIDAVDPESTQRMAESLAIGMAFDGFAEREPTAEPIVVGADASLLTDRVAELGLCAMDVSHRLIVAPDGQVRAVAGNPGCVADVLAQMTLSPDPVWRVVDVAWLASAMTAPIEEPATPEAAPTTSPKEPVPAAGSGTPKASPSARPGTVDVAGGIPKEVIRRVLARAASPIRACYDKQLATEPTLAGTTVMALTISSSGAVSAVKGDGALGASMDACMVPVLMRLTFPSSGDGKAVVIKMPYSFSPS